MSGSPEPTEDVVEFSDRRFRNLRIVRFSVVLLLGALLLEQILAARAGVHGILVLYVGIVSAGLVVLLVGLVRSFRIGIALDDDGVVARTTYATKRWRYDDLRGARLLDREVPTRRQYAGRLTLHEERTRLLPVLVRRDGLDFRLYGLKVFVSGYRGQDYWLTDAVREINERIERRRGATPR